MGQTLTHGVYLPDEGERNCYSGLAGNWTILDGAVGTVAEHTTQIAGKAPAVHTHTKSDITDFPAYGTTAGTICEGNDSRLSDARTPVAHTHGKADVTDLFNSANVWSNANTFTRNVDDSFLLFKSTKINALVPTDTNYHFADLNFSDVNSKIISKIRSSGAGTKIVTEITARSWSADGTTNEEVKLDLVSDIQNSDKKTTINSNFIPSANNSYDLGSSSYQWNNLYAKNYYYNGTAWGLDKANVWSADQATTGNLFIKSTTLQKGVIPSSNMHKNLYFSDKNGVNIGVIRLRLSTGGGGSFRVYGSTLVKDGQIDPTGAEFNWGFGQYLNPDGTTYFSFDGNIANNVIPTSSNYDLGTSTNKWKTLWANGINSVPTDTVEWHNSHYRGINLISDGHFANMAALLTAIRAQDWSDIYIGDYVELTFTYEGASRTVKFYVGEIDKFYNVGNTALTTHHLVMVTGNLGINQVMNDTNTTAGGYVGSKAHTVTLPALYAILNPLFNNAILTHREHLSNTVLSAQTVSLSLDDGNGAVTYSCNNFPVYSSGDPNTSGCVTAGDWYDCNLVLMSEIEMFGSNRFSSSGMDDIMCPEGQIAAFKYNHNLQTLNRTINTWLRNVNSASRFCNCSIYGYSIRSGATTTYIRLRPRFLIG